jgi:cyclophilin family peptidyl-prolyl cis-trans isomerase/HEAT repeat protein
VAQQTPAPPVLPTPERLARVLSLEDARSFGEGWLRDRVYDPDPEVRRRAVLALGRVGRPEAVEPLVVALTADEAGAVRSTAAFALGIVEDPLPAEAIAALEAALADTSSRVREKAIEAIGRRGGERAGEIVVRQLAAWVKASGYPDRREDVEAFRRRTSWDEARLGLFALARIRDDGGDPGDTGAVLGSNGSPRTLWWVSAWTAARLRDPELVSLHRVYANSPDPVIRALGVRGLGSTGLPLASELAPELNHPSDTVRIEAYRALRAQAEADLPVGSSTGARLASSLDDAVPAIRHEALRTLGNVRYPEVTGALIGRMQSPDPEVRAGAMRALYPQDEEGFFLLLSGWSDRDPVGKIAMARRLAEIEDPRISNFLLRNLLADDDPRVRAAALTGLGALEETLASGGNGNPEVTETLVSHLTAEDPYERAAAAGALGRLEVGGGDLRRAYGADTSEMPEFRLAALRAGLAQGTEGDRVAFAREALGDPAWPVRREAHEFLRRSGADDEEPAPAGTLEAAEYRAMLEAPFSPLAWIETAKGEIEIELFVADAPRTVSNFIRLAREGFYDGQSFHRVVPNFVLQAGDPRGDSSGGPGYTIRCEIGEGFYMRGSVGMALDGKDTGGSQFFITLLPQPHLNGRYTLFGHVRDGFAVLDQIEPGDRIRRIRIWDGITPPE